MLLHHAWQSGDGDVATVLGPPLVLTAVLREPTLADLVAG